MTRIYQTTCSTQSPHLLSLHGHQYFDQLAGAAMMEEEAEDGMGGQSSTKTNDKSEAAVEEDDWYQAMIDHASKSSCGKQCPQVGSSGQRHRP